MDTDSLAPVEPPLPEWARPLGQIIRTLLANGGGRCIVHYSAEGSPEKVEVSFSVSRKHAPLVMRQLGLQ